MNQDGASTLYTSHASLHHKLCRATGRRKRPNPTDWELEAWVSTYVAIATGELSVVSHSVKALTGHTPQTLADYLQKHQESYEHITANRL
jgi:hypothetical protein